MNVTKDINEYPFIGKINLLNNEQGRINIFDTPGFSSGGGELNKIKTQIKNIFSDYISNKDLIHCFLFFLDGRLKRSFDKDEIDLISFINRKQKENFIYSNHPYSKVENRWRFIW